MTATETLAVDLGQRLRQARVVRGLSCRGLSRRSGIGAVSKCENARQLPRLVTLHPLAAALEVPVVWLVFGRGEVPARERVRTVGPTLVRETFGRRVRFAREACGWTQHELAERIYNGGDQGNVSRLEAGHKGPTLMRVHRCVEALDVPAEWLLDTGEEIAPVGRLTPALVDRARVVRLLTGGPRVEGRSWASATHSDWFACRLVVRDSPESLDAQQGRRRVILAADLVCPPGVDLVASDDIEVCSVTLGHATWRVIGAPAVIRTRRKPRAMTVALQRTVEAGLQSVTA